MCLWGREAHADTVIDISATACDLSSAVSTIDLRAQLTVEAVNGTFFNPGLGFFFTGSVYEVKGITGTLNGNSISSFAAPLGDGSWLNFDLSLGTVYFSVGGFEGWLKNEGDYDLIALIAAHGAGGTSGTPINYSASVSTPETSSLLLLAAGLIAVGSALIPLLRSPFPGRPHSSKAL